MGFPLLILRNFAETAPRRHLRNAHARKRKPRTDWGRVTLYTVLERVWYLSQQVECICNIAKCHNVAYDSTSTEAFTEIAVTPITTRHLIISRAACINTHSRIRNHHNGRQRMLPCIGLPRGMDLDTIMVGVVYPAYKCVLIVAWCSGVSRGRRLNNSNIAFGQHSLRMT